MTLDGLNGAKAALARIDECIGKLRELAGGTAAVPNKEFIDSFLKAAFDPSLGLFCASSSQLLVPNPASSVAAETIAFTTSEREGKE